MTRSLLELTIRVARLPLCRPSACARTTSPTRRRTRCSRTTTLARSITEKGIYPAVDPLDSTSRILDARYIGQEHYDVAREVQRILQRYKDWDTAKSYSCSLKQL
jgi:hypothetical protein